MTIGYALNPQTGRIISKTTSKYKRLVKLGVIVEDELKEQKEQKQPQPKQLEEAPEPEKQPQEQEFDESKLQEKLADISTEMIQKNLKKVVKAQKLTDGEMDIMLKKMLYKKLCIEPKPKKKSKVQVKPKKKSKPKFVVTVESSSSESESESD